MTGPAIDPVMASLAGLQATAVVLILRRRPKHVGPPGRSSAACVLPSVAIGIVVARLAPPGSSWPLGLAAMFVAGAVWTLVSFLALGDSFGFLPSARALVTRGPYRWVRHPAYLGEVTMAASCTAATLATRTVTVGLVLALLAGGALLGAGLVWRIAVEERAVSSLEGWSAYTADTPYRLVPFVW